LTIDNCDGDDKARIHKNIEIDAVALDAVLAEWISGAGDKLKP